MFMKLAIFALVCVVVSEAVWTGPLAGGVPASQFPAGVSPQACPNYPNCHNPAVAANPSAPAPYAAPQQWNAAPQGQWNNQYNPPAPQQWSPYNQNALESGQYTGDGDYHGEGLAESGAYGNAGGQNGGWNPGPAAYNPAPAYNPGVPAQIPAGVDPGSCPNYPFCH